MMALHMGRVSQHAYRCRHCSRDFARSEHLTRHERTHTKEKPFRCEVCHQAFSRRDMLRRHEAKTHNLDQRPRDTSATTQHMSLRRESAVETQTSNQNQTPSQAQTGVDPPMNPEPLSKDATLPSTQATPISSLSSPKLPELETWMNGLMTSSFDGPIKESVAIMPSHSSSCWPDIAQAPFDGFEGMNIDFLQDGSLALGASNPAAQHPFEHYQSQTQQSPRQSVSCSPGGNVLATIPGWTDNTDRAMTDTCYKLIQEKISNHSPYILPPKPALSGFISRYFNSFHRHQPFLHESTWSPNTSPCSLVLAVCANGAVYNLEASIGQDLYSQAVNLLSRTDTGITTLQTLMLLTAFAAWTQNSTDVSTAFQFHTRLSLTLSREWALREKAVLSEGISWEEWREMEELRRVTYCIFTILNLVAVAYDLPSLVKLEKQHRMPACEALWTAATELEWKRASESQPQQPWNSAEEICQRLFDPSHSIPTMIGPFGCHVTILYILQKVLSLQRSIPGFFSRHTEHHRFVQALRRWQTMLESEPQTSFSSDHPTDPILFNCTALLRLTYVRLAADFCDVRSSFAFAPSEDDIVAKIELADVPPRTQQTTQAALQACQALQLPAQLGFRLVSRTKFWIWSVQHALSYFECALLLSKWLQTVERADDISQEEADVVSMVQQLLRASASQTNNRKSPELSSVTILHRLAELIDTGDTTVWRIVPQMAKVLRAYAERLSIAVNGA